MKKYLVLGISFVVIFVAGFQSTTQLCNGCAPLASPTFTGTVTIPTGASIAAPTISGAASLTGNTTFSGTPAASTAGLYYNNTTCYSGGSATTNYPSVFINQSTTFPTTWSTSCTVFGINAPTGTLGNIIDIHQNGGAGIWKVNSSGATLSTGYDMISGHILISNTAPSAVTAGSGASIGTTNGTAVFTVNVGTGGTASTAVITLPTATTGWFCSAVDITNPTTGGGYYVKMTANSTTSCTLTGYNTSGTATAWTASDVLVVTALGY